jgi:hypothetical protein
MANKLKRYGVVRAVVHIHAGPSRETYEHARLSVLRAEEGLSYEPTWFALEFQRHRLDVRPYDNSAYADEEPHPLFDVGATPWSRFYAGRLVADALYLDKLHGLSAVLRVVRRILAAKGQTNCDLVNAMQGVEAQGVKTMVRFHREGEEGLASMPTTWVGSRCLRKELGLPLLECDPSSSSGS